MDNKLNGRIFWFYDKKGKAPDTTKNDTANITYDSAKSSFEVNKSDSVFNKNKDEHMMFFVRAPWSENKNNKFFGESDKNDFYVEIRKRLIDLVNKLLTISPLKDGSPRSGAVASKKFQYIEAFDELSTYVLQSFSIRFQKLLQEKSMTNYKFNNALKNDFKTFIKQILEMKKKPNDKIIKANFTNNRSTNFKVFMNEYNDININLYVNSQITYPDIIKRIPGNDLILPTTYKQGKQYDMLVLCLKALILLSGVPNISQK
jgi:hypothetical protein